MEGFSFNPAMLVLARESRGLTQAEFAALASCSQAEISRYETGLRTPNDKTVDGFAETLGFTREFFSLGETIRAFGSPCVYHRKKQSTKERVFKQLLAKVNVHRIQIQGLLRACELVVENRFVRIDVDSQTAPPEHVARQVRKVWEIPPGPIPDLVRVIENCGGIVVPCDFGPERVDALSQWSPGVPPLLFTNREIPADRLRFTLAHEIGHLVMHQYLTPDMEAEADRFAAEFMMPESDVRPYLSGVSLPKLASLKPYWRVSMAALLKRAGDLGTVTKADATALWMKMSRAGYRRTEPIEIPPEHPSLLDEIVRVHRDRLGMSLRELDVILYARDDRNRALLPAVEKQALRLVR